MNRRNSYISISKNRIGKKTRFAIDCIVLLLFLFILIFVVILPQYSHDMNATIEDKIKRAKDIKEPAILLAGDSNLIFGVDSKVLEEAMGMPVVNLGLHAGLGNDFLLRLAEYCAEPGDIVVCSFVKYNMGKNSGNEELKWTTIENHFSYYRFIAPEDAFEMVRAFPSYLRDATNHWINGKANVDLDSGYNRKFFNEYGDSDFPRPEPIKYYDESDGIPEITDEFVEDFNEYYDILTKRGVKVVLAGFPVYVCDDTPAVSEYEAFEEELCSRLKCECISDINEYMMDKELFWDSKYHLNDKAVPVRTELLIHDLEPVIGAALRE
ncbi:MAG: hypothetical protein K5888_08140 [Lachnospiraceae bacterium]|nr:hypothetical protein [Lachnospiraceae bacterium]